MKEQTRTWKLALHTFFAFFTLCFFVKGLYFATTSDPYFSLIQHPSTSELWLHAVIAMGIAGIFAAIVWYAYHVGRAQFSRWFASMPPATLVRRDQVIAWIGLLGAFYYLYTNRSDLLFRLQSGQFLLRYDQVIDERFVGQFMRGEFGLAEFFKQILTGLMIIFAAYAVLRRNRLLVAVSAVYLVSASMLANGSRFNLLSTLLMLPVLFYVLYHRRPSHQRRYAPAIYGAVLLLPLFASILLLSRNTFNPTRGMGKTIFNAMLVSFDPMDHLINYVYLTPVDWTAQRPLEDFWLVVPRRLVPDKPFVYGSLELQETMYPGVIGAGRGIPMFGHYPISCVVAALELLPPIGFLIHAILTGLFLALVDAALERRSLLSVAFFMMNIFSMYHLVRVGIVTYLLQGVQANYLPLLLAWLLLQFGSARVPVSALPKPQQVT